MFLHVKLPSRGDSPTLLTVFMCQVYFADFLNQRLRKLVKSGTGNDWYIYTVAGTGVSWPIGGFVQDCPSKLFKQQLFFFFPVLFVWKIDVESNRKKRSFIRCSVRKSPFRSVGDLSVRDEQVMATDDSCDAGCVPLLTTSLGFAS